MKHERASRAVRVAPWEKEGVRAVVRDTSARDKLQLPTRCQPTHLNIWAGSNANHNCGILNLLFLRHHILSGAGHLYLSLSLLKWLRPPRELKCLKSNLNEVKWERAMCGDQRCSCSKGPAFKNSMSTAHSIGQGKKRWSPGLVKFIPALAYHSAWHSWFSGVGPSPPARHQSLDCLKRELLPCIS